MDCDSRKEISNKKSRSCFYTQPGKFSDFAILLLSFSSVLSGDSSEDDAISQRIAANSVVLSEVPPDSTAVGIPARIVWRKGQRKSYASEVDQVNVSDPVAMELNSIKEQLLAITSYLRQN